MIPGPSDLIACTPVSCRPCTAALSHQPLTASSTTPFAFKWPKIHISQPVIGLHSPYPWYLLLATGKVKWLILSSHTRTRNKIDVMLHKLIWRGFEGITFHFIHQRNPNYCVRPVVIAYNIHFSYKLTHPGETALELNYEDPIGICLQSCIKPFILENMIKSRVLLQWLLQSTLDCTPCSADGKQPSPTTDKGTWTSFTLCFIQDKSLQSSVQGKDRLAAASIPLFLTLCTALKLWSGSKSLQNLPWLTSMYASLREYSCPTQINSSIT